MTIGASVPRINLSQTTLLPARTRIQRSPFNNMRYTMPESTAK